jgi:hypothetical protein
MDSSKKTMQASTARSWRVFLRLAHFAVRPRLSNKIYVIINSKTNKRYLIVFITNNMLYLIR